MAGIQDTFSTNWKLPAAPAERSKIIKRYRESAKEINVTTADMLLMPFGDSPGRKATMSAPSMGRKIITLRKLNSNYISFRPYPSCDVVLVIFVILSFAKNPFSSQEGWILQSLCSMTTISNFNPISPPRLGDLWLLGDTPRPPKGGILYLLNC